MAVAAKRKSRPVSVSDPITDCSQWVSLKNVERNTKKALESLKDRIALLVPHTHGEAREYGPAERLSEKGIVERGHYLVQHVAPDRRSIDEEKFMALLVEKFGDRGALKYTKPVLDDEKIKPLLEDGTITKGELKACLAGGSKAYNLCEWKPDK
jgi:hypothetical protein